MNWFLSHLVLILPFPDRVAIWNGLLSDEIVPISANCPTGNCTWPITPSLAVCAECSPSSYERRCDSIFCNYTLPSGSQVTLENPGEDYEQGGFAVLKSNGAKYNASLQDKLYIANFDVVGWPFLESPRSASTQSVTASECALWMCIQAYNVSTRSNRQSQTIVQTISSLNTTLQTFSSINATRSYEDYYNYTFPKLSAEMNAMPNTNFTVAFWGAETYRSTLDIFNGTGTMGFSSIIQSDPIDAVWRASSNLDPWIKRLALSMTNALRNGSAAPSHSFYDGTGYQLGVSIRWQWIILPAALVLLSILFLVVVMVQTARSPVAAWKGSPLAILFFNVEQEMRWNVIGQTDKYMGIENAVGNVRVRLEGQPGDIRTFKAA